MSELTLVLDPGASLSKIFYSVDAGPLLMLLMLPEVIPTTEEAVTDKAAAVIAKIPDDKQAWVQWGKEFWAVGQLAKDLGAATGLKGLKWEPALYKVLAAVGVIVRQERLSEPINLKLGLLLPNDEYSSYQEFEPEIQKALSEFKFQHQKISVSLKTFRCRPEGGGLLGWRCAELGQERLNKVITVLAIGFRNASCTWSRRGAKAEGNTSGLGYYKYLDGIIRRTWGQTYDSLTVPVYLAGSQVSADVLSCLLRATNPKYQKSELAKLVKSIKAAREEYCRSLFAWLIEVLPPDTNEIILAGGTAEYLKPVLTKRYGKDVITLLPELEQEVKIMFPSSTAALVPRLLDGYSFSRSLIKEPVLNGKR